MHHLVKFNYFKSTTKRRTLSRVIGFHLSEFLVRKTSTMETTFPQTEDYFVWTRCCCSVFVISLQHRSCSVYMSFVRLGHHNG